MAEESAKLRIPYIAAAQAQKHVTHNEGMTLLDTLVQLSVLDKDLSTPPGSSAEGDTYIVAGGGGTATGAWIGWEKRVVRFLDGTWRSYLPGAGSGAGWLAWVTDEDAMYRFDGAAWALAGIAGPPGPAGSAGPTGPTGPTGPAGAASLTICRVKTTANVTVGGGGLANGTAHDGVTVNTDDRILVSEQASAAENGVYIVPVSGAASRDTAFDTYDEHPGVYLSIMEGSAYGDTLWRCTSNRGGTLGTNPIIFTQFQDSNGGGMILAPQGRLTLTTAVPVLTADVTAATAIYYTPWVGRSVPIYDGTKFVNTDIGGELSLALDSNSGHTGYHQSGKNFDLFVINDGGTIRLASGPAWSSDTARAESLSRLNGVLVSDASIVLRFGSASGNTVTYTNRATYVGTFRASADGQTQMKFGGSASGGTPGAFNLWNAYNQEIAAAVVRDSASAWTYNSTTPRQAHASAGNQVQLLIGVSGRPVVATYVATVTAGSVSAGCGVGIGLDSTSAYAAGSDIGFCNASGADYPIAAIADLYPDVGWHTVAALENVSSANTSTFYGASGAAKKAGLHVRVWC